MSVRSFISKAIVACSVAFAAPAVAEPILLDSDSIGDSFTISFDGFVDGGASIDGLSSELTLTLTGIENGVYTFDYSVTNTGADGDGIDSRVSGFAFNTDPEIDAASSTGVFGYTSLDRNYPNQIGTVDVCLKGQSGGSCAGGGSAGMYDGETGTGTLSLTFNSAPNSLTLDDFYVRYQSISGIENVTSATGRQTSTGSTSGTDVPEPGMMMLFAAAVLGLYFATRRRFPAFDRKPSHSYT